MIKPSYPMNSIGLQKRACFRSVPGSSVKQEGIHMSEKSLGRPCRSRALRLHGRLNKLTRAQNGLSAPPTCEC
jgi:hypothetical protein